MKRLACALGLMLLIAAPAAAQEIASSMPNLRPESLSMGPDGSLYIGSNGAPVVLRAKPGATTADIFIDMRRDNAAFALGVYADASEHTLWVCEMLNMDRSTPLLKGKGVLRAFDLTTGADKGHYTLPETTNICNDASRGPDGALYLADTSNGKILRLKRGAKAFETVIQNSALYGVDGITFLNGQLYVNTVWSNNLYRIPLDAAGKAGNPVQIQTSHLLVGPDGMRAGGGRLFVAESGAGRVSAIRIEGDRGTVTPVHTGLGGPTAVEPVNGKIWITDRPTSKVIGIPMPK